MKKIIVIFLALLIFTGCNIGSKNKANTDTYSGKETALSKKYLSKGYVVNIYRSAVSLGDDDENYGKSYITMTFNVITELASTIGYDDTNNHIKKKVIKNIRLIKTPKMGIVGEIYPDYYDYGLNVELKGSNNSYTKEYSTPIYYSDQTSIAVTLNHIALFDIAAYGLNEQPSTTQIYNDLGITREAVALTLGFRIELTTVEGRILFKDYEIEMPPKGYDIGGTEFQMNFMADDISQMNTFLEKE